MRFFKLHNFKDSHTDLKQSAMTRFIYFNYMIS